MVVAIEAAGPHQKVRWPLGCLGELSGWQRRWTDRQAGEPGQGQGSLHQLHNLAVKFHVAPIRFPFPSTHRKRQHLSHQKAPASSPCPHLSPVLPLPRHQEPSDLPFPAQSHLPAMLARGRARLTLLEVMGLPPPSLFCSPFLI